MMRCNPNPNVSSGSAAVIGNCVAEPVTCALYASVATSNGRNPSPSGIAARSSRRGSRRCVQASTPTAPAAHITASNGRVMKIQPTSAPATTSRPRRPVRTPEQSAVTKRSPSPRVNR